MIYDLIFPLIIRESREIVCNIEKVQLSNENGIFSAQINHDGSLAVIGLGSGSVQVRCCVSNPIITIYSVTKLCNF